MTGRLSTSEFRGRISETLDVMSNPDNWIILTRRGDDAAAIVSMDLFRRINEFDERPRTYAGHQDRTRRTSQLETAAIGIPETKSEIDPAAEVEVEDLMSRIEATRQAIGLAPYGDGD